MRGLAEQVYDLCTDIYSVLFKEECSKCGVPGVSGAPAGKAWTPSSGYLKSAVDMLKKIKEET